MPITLLDGILVGFTLVSAMLAMVRGFSREVLSIVSWVAAAAAAFFFYKPVLPYVQPYVDNDKIAMAAAAGVVFVIALIVVSVITMKLADWIIDSRIGALDRTLGFLYGAARGVLVVAVALLFFNWLAGAKAPGWVANAKSRPLLETIGAKLESLLPENTEDLVNKYTHKGAPATETPVAPGATTDQPAAEPPANGDDADAPADDSEGEAPADNAPAPAPASPAPAN
ncbi:MULTISPECIES: CvpA family protein [unclassified Mesorhizobium]|uniref:CvpA family protein n=1 Tax=Mesorhizobium TaxID=68287 RepID=UPI000FCC5FE7|nr:MULTISPECIES: CvpA family protein [unclassified Mesorhizobium]RUW20912.1 CvpA family protein [Mesorhizobium sp. M4B.F.Ca.ET.013.02.1.1]RUW69794.1 CvpA family protein [Mesorhizobium sp. M4B.F.Ca.ET.049.02.1.2]RVD20511.1 CvpA family protein [Mesorhizobium sp. M4B.F.Ca.ET.017.02.2.1]RVD39872.1 CvpA family protein [Mesorhizobium sp. M4B.F.Ca.ET.019.03.1.1]TGQ13135.1 CvpA family protein [Mesorhizobium sp. M4B.F.Ca.ET.215.01.1.1]